MFLLYPNLFLKLFPWTLGKGPASILINTEVDEQCSASCLMVWKHTPAIAWMLNNEPLTEIQKSQNPQKITLGVCVHSYPLKKWNIINRWHFFKCWGKTLLIEIWKKCIIQLNKISWNIYEDSSILGWNLILCSLVHYTQQWHT